MKRETRNVRRDSCSVFGVRCNQHFARHILHSAFSSDLLVKGARAAGDPVDGNNIVRYFVGGVARWLLVKRGQDRKGCSGRAAGECDRAFRKRDDLVLPGGKAAHVIECEIRQSNIGLSRPESIRLGIFRGKRDVAGAIKSDNLESWKVVPGRRIICLHQECLAVQEKFWRIDKGTVRERSPGIEVVDGWATGLITQTP